MPALNYPAVLEDSRVSPLDGGNMNRAYPGGRGRHAHLRHRPLGGGRCCLPKCDAALDLHSGGKASEYLPVRVSRRERRPGADVGEARCGQGVRGAGHHRGVRHPRTPRLALGRGGPSRRGEPRDRARRGRGRWTSTPWRSARRARGVGLPTSALLKSEGVPARRSDPLPPHPGTATTSSSRPIDGLFEPRVRLGGQGEGARRSRASCIRWTIPSAGGAEVRFSAAGGRRVPPGARAHPARRLSLPRSASPWRRRRLRAPDGPA